MLNLLFNNLITNLLALDVKTIGDFVKDTLRSIAATIDYLIYQLVAFLYKLFFFVSSTELFQNDNIINISRNFQLLVAVVVMFSISISLINYIVNPDNMKGGKMPANKIVTKVVTSLILLLTVNIIFATAYRLQNAIIQNNFVGKLIMGDKAQSYDIESMGLSFSKSILSAFVTTNTERSGTIPSNRIQSADQLFNEVITKEEQYHLLAEFINDKDDGGEYILNYNALSIPVGLFIGYILLTYVVGVGVRTVQLFYLQIIAPVPILFYVLPNGDDKLKKWTQQCITTYLDLFIRHLIIYLTIFLCSNLLSTDGTLIIPSGADDYKNWIILALVIAIMLFAKKAPDLIKELFPATSKASGDFGLNLGKQFKGTAAGAVLGAGVGGIAGAATGLLSGGGIGGMIGGFNRGAYGGLRGKKLSDTMSKTKQYGNMRRDQGITGWDRMGVNMRNTFGVKDRLSGYEKQISHYDKQAKLAKAITDRAKELAYSSDATGSYTLGGKTYTGGVNTLKSSIEYAKSVGNSQFRFAGQEFNLIFADKMLKSVEKTATNSIIDGGSDDQINAMMGNLQTMAPTATDATNVRAVAKDAETKKVQIENSTGYVNAVRQKQGK